MDRMGFDGREGVGFPSRGGFAFSVSGAFIGYADSFYTPLCSC